MIVDNWALTPTTFVAVQNKTGRLKMQRVICVIAGVGKANNGKAKKHLHIIHVCIFHFVQSLFSTTLAKQFLLGKYVCMYKNLCSRSSLDCHEGAVINCRLYRTFQSLSVSRTETVTSSCRELSVVVSSTVFDQSTRSFVVHSSWSCSN